MGQDTKNPDHQFLHSAEEGLRNGAMRYPSPILEEILSSFPVTLNIGVKVADDALGATKYSENQEIRLLLFAIEISNLACDSFLRDMKAEIHAGKGLRFRYHHPGFSIAMCAWVQEGGVI